MTILRHSSRRASLRDMLAERLSRTRRYLRIAGYFRSSLLELVSEELGGVDEIRIICNAEVDANDVRVARSVETGALSQALVSAWMADRNGLDELLEKGRYRILHGLLASGRMKVRVVPRDGGNVFLHGKAGILEFRDGGSTAFVGSMNESATGLKHSYEILWEDDAPEATEWVREEFEHFWALGVDLPSAVIGHIGSVAGRSEYASIEDARRKGELSNPAASLVDRPIYRTGQVLRPWQKRFVQACVDDHAAHGKARFLLADDVGLGKTLSLGAAALVLALLSDGPVLILAPATLTRQWQTELVDMLGIPSAIWSSTRKQWIDGEDFAISSKGDASAVARCPVRIGIVSTGVIVSGDDQGEAAHLRGRRFGVVVLDEAHKARADRGGKDGGRVGAKRLLDFMERIAANSENVLLGTATPIQLDAVEIHDLVALLSKGAIHVLGKEGSRGWISDTSMDYLTGERDWPTDPTDQWGLLRNPLAPMSEDAIYRKVRSLHRMAPSQVEGPRYEDLSRGLKSQVRAEFAQLATQTNPIIRRVIRRSRPMLEDAGLLSRIEVMVHPRQSDGLPVDLFSGAGLEMGLSFRMAYDAAIRFCALYVSSRPSAGFMKTILLRRIGSSVEAGLNTTRMLLQGAEPRSLVDDDDDLPDIRTERLALTPSEISCLREVEGHLAAVSQREGLDPKVAVIAHYLGEGGWLRRHGMIAFSQFYDTAEFLGRELARLFPEQPIAIYAGGGRSFVLSDGERRRTDRNAIKDAVRDGSIKLVAATDAACEGLNLQRLGAQVNVDLPWNPSRLEQRKGRIQRIGQTRSTIHVANLRYANTYEDDVYSALSERFSDIFQVLGQLPDSFEDDWVDAILRDRDAVKSFPARVKLTKPAVERRYSRDVAGDTDLTWEATETILSSRDIAEFMRKGW
ncbi:helicase-related protein [Methylobacterium sp. J-092]|uniref:helicase-related protein n=1 Tax=Methylobacterium sp. J-092 TaxID=2836667 RepID=UPI001FB94EAA|nr:helicase-related protein [Methylobacterium sp. J-092]MCJ2007046.1 phospholipase D-like domain-containing protein [Methylobacterium sp. J-092]